MMRKRQALKITDIILRGDLWRPVWKLSTVRAALHFSYGGELHRMSGLDVLEVLSADNPFPVILKHRGGPTLGMRLVERLAQRPAILDELRDRIENDEIVG